MGRFILLGWIIYDVMPMSGTVYYVILCWNSYISTNSWAIKMRNGQPGTWRTIECREETRARGDKLLLDLEIILI